MELGTSGPVDRSSPILVMVGMLISLDNHVYCFIVQIDNLHAGWHVARYSFSKKQLIPPVCH